MGETGPEGPTGPAATIQIGSVTTGDPGTEAQVTNSGDENNAIFDFVIPRGEPGGGGGVPEVLATVDQSPQGSNAGGALIFNENPLISGAAITHTPGAPNIQITQPGIYQVTFNGSVRVDAGTAIPASVQVRLTNNGVDVPGAVAIQTFGASDEEANVTFSAPIRVDSVPANLEVIVNDAGYTFEELALNVYRLGDAT